ncbi:MAG TPA: prepilin-type N-terminal cleavage/methylation domain-containing protein [Phycisphaerales bacterium]|nr:prepilin-type N-terminal cleavage/methylation domain-containing protein [Phycisphaerales bacterium]
MQRQRSGFTLIELLVVIAIIALLIGILIPALSKARNTARSLKCLTNVRSMGQVMTYYANDYKNWYPIVPRPANASTQFLDDQGRFGGLAGFFSLNQQGSDDGGSAWTANTYLPPTAGNTPVLKKYMPGENFEMLACPMDKLDIFYATAWGTGRPLTVSLLNSAYPGPGSPASPGRRIPRAPRSEQEVIGYNISYLYIAGLMTDEPAIPVPPPIWGDETLANDYGTDAWYGAGGNNDQQGATLVGSQGPGYYGERDNHGAQGGNFAYVDGHAKFETQNVHDFFFGSGPNSINAARPGRSARTQTVD